MDINYYMKIQNAYKTKSRREKELVKVNRELDKHHDDTFDTKEVLVNGKPMNLMIVKDTDGNTFKKKIKSKHNDKFNLGDYVVWNGQYWLVTLLDSDEKTWNRGYMYLCTVLLRWQNPEGKIIERWAYSEDFTKYSSGTFGNNVMTLGDNQYGLTIPIDNETKRLKRDMRFPIDFEDSDEPDIYMLTNRKVKLNDDSYFGRGGTMIVTMSYDAFNKDRDQKVKLKDGRVVWICDYQPMNSKKHLQNNEVRIDYITRISGSKNIKIGFEKSYTVNFFDKNGESVDYKSFNYSWNVSSDFNVNYQTADNKIILSVDNEEYIDRKILLQVISNTDNNVLGEHEITVVNIM